MVPPINYEGSEKADQLRLRLRHLELEYGLANAGLEKTRFATITVSVVAVLVTGMGFVASMWGKREFLSGTNVVAIGVVAAVGLLAFASLVFGRSFKLRSQISKTKKELEIVLGESVR